MPSRDPATPLSFPGEGRVDARTGDVVLLAYSGLRFFQCRIKRSALKPLTGRSLPSDAEVLAAAALYKARIEQLIAEQVTSGESTPVIDKVVEQS
jgi:hypothetical protein